jgi:hypothetical protein
MRPKGCSLHLTSTAFATSLRNVAVLREGDISGRHEADMTDGGRSQLGPEAGLRPFVETVKSPFSAFCDKEDLDERVYVRRIGR